LDPIIERRYADIDAVEMREEGGRLGFRGHAAVFDSVTDLGPFRERVASGAFRKTVQEADVRFLFNHEPDSVMARTVNGTLRLKEDAQGLVTEADLDPADWDVQRLAPKLRSGNVSQMSFAFRVVGPRGEEWDDQPEDGGKPIRTLRELALFDVSPVTYPAYAQTDASLRCGIAAVAERRASMLREIPALPSEESVPPVPDPALDESPPGPEMEQPEASASEGSEELPPADDPAPPPDPMEPPPEEEPAEEPPETQEEPAARSTTLPARLTLQLARLAEIESTLTS
jgi:uncharacterized protein